MSSLETSELTAILHRVKQWPSPDRLQLARTIMATVEMESAASSPTHATFKDLLGLLKTDGPPPNDDECRAILEDELAKKLLK